MGRVDVTVPVYGMTESDSYIERWLVSQGDSVKEGDPLVMIETAKAEVEMEAPASGIVGDLLVPADTEVPPGTKLTWIQEADK